MRRWIADVFELIHFSLLLVLWKSPTEVLIDSSLLGDTLPCADGLAPDSDDSFGYRLLFQLYEPLEG